ncbi:MAG: hypothetical protein ACRD1L_11140 [Terriglobales bacterium]
MTRTLGNDDGLALGDAGQQLGELGLGGVNIDNRRRRCGLRFHALGGGTHTSIVD